MLNVSLICVGSLKERYWRDACDEYINRLGAFCRAQVVEIAEERAPENPSAAQIAQVLAAEGKRILAKIPADSAVMALCIEGKPISSPQLAAQLEQLAVGGKSHLAVVIGGSWGLSDEVKARAAWRLSMSPMTFPHQLARVMMLEQLYRAAQIQSGGRYHK